MARRAAIKEILEMPDTSSMRDVSWFLDSMVVPTAMTQAGGESFSLS
jgi:hypothetical protein